MSKIHCRILATVKLEPLICPSCGGPVALAAGAQVPCPQCDSPVEIPEAHQQLRQASEKRQALRRHLTELYTRLGSPPGALLQAASAFATLWILLLTLIFCGGVLFGLVVCIGQFFHTLDTDNLLVAGISSLTIGLFMIPVMWVYFWHAMAPTLGVDLADYLLGGMGHLALGTFLYLFVVLPTVLFTLADQFTTLRQQVRAMLAAKPPATQGGAALCRQCGAGLEVEPGQQGVVCPYCDADNLVNIPAELLQAVKLEAKDFKASVEEADSYEHNTRRDNRHWAINTLRNWLLIVPLLWLMGWATEALVDGPERPPRFVYPSQPPNATIQVHGKWSAFVSLRKGEELVYQKGPEGSQMQLQRRKVSSWYAPEWKWVSLGQDWRAPYTGWYRILIEGEGSGELRLERKIAR